MIIANGVKAPPAIVVSRSTRMIPNPETVPIPSAGGGYAPRRFRINKSDLETHGYTAGCPGCISAQADDGIRRGGHTEACRLRIEGVISDGRKDREQQSMTVDSGDKIQEQDAVPAVVLQDNAVVGTETQSRGNVSQGGASGSSDVFMPDEEVIVEDAPVEASGQRTRYKTPERPAPIKRRGDDDDDGFDRLRRRIDSPNNDGMGAPSRAEDPDMEQDSPLRAWYDSETIGEADTSMSELTEVDRRILASAILNVDITEVFSPERINQVASKFGLVPGSSLDLRTGWNFELESHRRKAWGLLHRTQPYVVIGSPPCTFFSQLQEINKHVHRDDPLWMKNFEEGKKVATRHIDFCISIFMTSSECIAS